MYRKRYVSIETPKTPEVARGPLYEHHTGSTLKIKNQNNPSRYLIRRARRLEFHQFGVVRSSKTSDGFTATESSAVVRRKRTILAKKYTRLCGHSKYEMNQERRCRVFWKGHRDWLNLR